MQRPGCPCSRVQVFVFLQWWKLSQATGPPSDFMPPSFLAGTSGCLVFKCSPLLCRICPPAVPAHKLLFSPALLQAACSPVMCNVFFSMKTPKIFLTAPQKLLGLSGLLLGSPGRWWVSIGDVTPGGTTALAALVHIPCLVPAGFYG